MALKLKKLVKKQVLLNTISFMNKELMANTMYIWFG